MVLANLSIYCTWKNTKSACNSNKFKTSAPTLNDEFDLLDRSYSISDVQDYLNNLSMQIYVNKIKNRTVFKIKTVYKLELLSPKTMKLLGSTKKDVDQDKAGVDVPKLESVEDLLKSKILFIFVSNKQFCLLITISPHSLTMLNTTNTEFISIEVWVTD